MTEQLEMPVLNPNETLLKEPQTAETETPPLPETLTAANGVTAETGETRNQHAEAGRAGAKRFHELVERGRLYEQEHGLKRGRQRLRQLVEEGRLYEQEHGLNLKRPRKRRTRLSNEEMMRRFLDVLLRMVKPSYRPQLEGLLQALETEKV